MSKRVIGAALVALLLLAAAWVGIGRMSWKEDATAVPAAGSAAGDVRATSAPTGSRETVATAARTAVAPTSAANGHGPTAVPADQMPGAANGVAPAAEADQQDPDRAARDGRGAAGQGGGAGKAKRFTADLQGLQHAIGSVLPEMRQCYAAWRKLRPGLEGAMRVHMTIEPDAQAKDDAHVTRAEIVDDKLHHPAVAGCVQNALDELTFEPPQGGKLDVVLPLQFAGPEDDAPKVPAAKPVLAVSHGIRP